MPQPHYYLVRPGPVISLSSGCIPRGPVRLVPLIPVDQLPAWLEIVNAPRELAAADAIKMTAIFGANEDGQEGENSSVFEVRVLSNDTLTLPSVPPWPKEKSKTDENDEDEDENEDKGESQALVSLQQHTRIRGIVVDEAAARSTNEFATDDLISSIQPLRFTGEDIKNFQYETASKTVPIGGTASSSNAVLLNDLIYFENQPSEESKTANENKTDDKGTKVPAWRPKNGWPTPVKRSTSVHPCRHWCRTGFCSFGQNCHFAHIMPQTPEGLRYVNLEQVPEWWLAKQAARERGEEDKSTHPGRWRSTERSPRPYYQSLSETQPTSYAVQAFRPPRSWRGSTDHSRVGTPTREVDATASPVQPVIDLEDEDEDLMDL